MKKCPCGHYHRSKADRDWRHRFGPDARAGELNGRAKLSCEHLILLREQYAQHRVSKWQTGDQSPFSIQALADQYDVAYSTMHSALTGKSWKISNNKKENFE